MAISLCLVWGLSGEEVGSWEASPNTLLRDIIFDVVAELPGIVRILFDGELLPEDLHLPVSTFGCQDVLLSAVRTKDHKYGRLFIPYLSVNRSHAVKFEELGVVVEFDPWTPQRLKRVLSVMRHTWESEFGKQMLELLNDLNKQVLRRRMERFISPSDGPLCNTEASIVFVLGKQGSAPTVAVRMEKAPHNQTQTH